METTDKIFDLIVIGGGPAGFSAAIRASKLGLSTLLAEKDRSLGGTCLNRGCIPTKAMLHSSGLVRQIRSASSFGVDADCSLDEAKLFEYRDNTVKTLVSGLEQSVKASGCEVVSGKASILSVEGGMISVGIGEADGAFRTDDSPQRRGRKHHRAVVALADRPHLLRRSPRGL